MSRLPVVVPLLMFVGCAHQPQASAPPIPQPPQPVAAAAPPPARPAEPDCAGDSACNEKELCIRGRCVDMSNGLAECTQVRIHFELNSPEIAGADTPALDRSARCLKSDQALSVTIESHADEHGSEESKLSLADRRATVVRAYLESIGVSATQLRRITYAREQPLCTALDEECSKSRRGEAKTQAQAAVRTRRARR
jgi:outer membrane protein OmpA-like peptidoglycan-associated protein